MHKVITLERRTSKGGIHTLFLSSIFAANGGRTSTTDTVSQALNRVRSHQFYPVDSKSFTIDRNLHQHGIAEAYTGLYTVTLPLYYARFMYSNVSAVALFDWGIVWLEHGPVIVLLAYEWRRAPTAEHSAAVSAGSCASDHSFVPASDFRSSAELDA